MACITHIRHILKRDGVNQFDRLPDAFDPFYVKIDEKHNEELMQLIAGLAAHVQFYNSNNLKDGDWRPFFEDFSKQHEPHIALMHTFLKLFQEARDHLNEIGRRHLDFYYQRFLQIKQKAAVPDKAHLIIEIAKGVDRLNLPKGTKFAGGKDQSGKPLVYQSERDAVINKSKIGELKSVFVDVKRQHALFAAPVANSADGQGEPFKAPDQKWPAFGAPQSGLPLSKRSMIEVATGFAIASPAFWMKEGERKITLYIHLSELNDSSGLKLKTLLNRNMNNTLQAAVTGDDGWIENLDVSVSYRQQKKRLVLSIVIPPGASPVVAYDNQVHDGAYDVAQPVLSITTKPQPGTPPYNWLRSLRFSFISISVNVKGIRTLMLANEQGQLDGGKPFQPFGPAPNTGAAFYFGCEELFSKKLTTLKLNYKWKDLPTESGGFSTYYRHYGKSYTNQGFEFGLSALNLARWIDEPTNVQRHLFSLKKDVFRIIGRGTFTFYSLLNNEVTHDLDVSAFGFEQRAEKIQATGYSQKAKNGFMRMVLAGQDFGHKAYPSALAAQSVKVGKALMANPEETPPALPNPPYTPVMEYISLDYTCESVIDLVNAFASEGNAFYHLHPFGPAALNLSEVDRETNLAPQFNSQGYFYIGLKELTPPQQLSILFQVADDSADPAYIEPGQQIKWSYLTGNGWQDFKPNEIISDTTNHLLKTGIIIFNIPTEAVNTNRSMPAAMHWLCGAFSGDVRGVNRLIAIFPQAITAVLDDQGNDPSHYAAPLKNGTIARLVNNMPEIKKIEQPFSSFGGKMPETGMRYPIPYYTRVSERLRHKNRAVSVWDIERLVLNNFPHIYKVKALNHASDKNDIAPGNITLLVIEKIRNKNAVNPLQPATGRNTLLEIKGFLKKYVSPFVEIFVQNPIYEEVQVSFSVAFRQGYDAGYYKNQLNDDIRQFLSPWAYEDGEDIVFGNVIYKSAIQYFVEKRKYVDYITGFTMSHIKPNWGIGCMEILHDFVVGDDDTLVDVDKAEPKTSRSILVSAPEHEIQIITDTN